MALPIYISNFFKLRNTPYALRGSGHNVVQDVYNSRYLHNSYTRWSRVRILANQRSESVVRIEIHFDVFSQLYLSLFFMKLVEIL
jgi:hypothetical protein